LFCFVSFFGLACAELSQFNHDTNPFVFLVENYFFRMSKQKSASGKKNKKQKFFFYGIFVISFFVCLLAHFKLKMSSDRAVQVNRRPSFRHARRGKTTSALGRRLVRHLLHLTPEAAGRKVPC
jgi:hypothetical protein